MGTKFRDAKLSDYTIHDIATGESGELSGILYNYYLYIHARGFSIIMIEKQDETEYRYADAGSGTSQWVNRDTLAYVTYDKLA